MGTSEHERSSHASPPQLPPVEPSSNRMVFLADKGCVGEQQHLTIRELATRTGVSSKTLRDWEDRGLLPLPGRTQTGYRVYPTDSIKRVQFILKAKAIGFTLSEILTLFGLAQEKANTCVTVNNWVNQKLKTLDRQIELLTQLRAQLLRYRRRWYGRFACPSLSHEEICCLI